MTEREQAEEAVALAESRLAVTRADQSAIRAQVVVNKSRLALAGVRQVRDGNGFHDTFLRLIRGDAE